MKEQAIKVLYLSYKDDQGGAFIGAKRLHLALKNEGINSTMLVRRKLSDDPSVIQYRVNVSKSKERFNNWIISKMDTWRTKLNGTNSFNLRHTGVHEIINNSDADCVIMHWIGNDTISLREIGLIKKPIIWRLADMWAFSGCKHYSSDIELSALEKYQNKNISNIDNLVWRRKERYWKSSSFKIVCGSDWLSNKVRTSKLLNKCEVQTIPSSFDICTFSPKANFKNSKLRKNNICSILFGAQHALTDPRKGFDLLIQSLLEVKRIEPDFKFKLRVFGSDKVENISIKNIEVECLGYIADEIEMAKIYNAADIFIIPSIFETLGFTAMESLACGTPVVGYKVGGIPEVVDHKKNGYLATPLNCQELAQGIIWTHKKQASDVNYLRDNAREKAVAKYSYQAQARSYIDLIRSI